jgi:hypothetical protein
MFHPRIIAQVMWLTLLITVATPALVQAALINENVQINLVSDVMGLARIWIRTW